MKKYLRLKRSACRQAGGIALIMVLSAITILTTIGVEFAYNTSIYYRLATNAKNRLQAEYLAKSALNLIRMEMKLDKQIRTTVNSMNANQYLGGQSMGPLCEQFPFSTSLLRMMFAGDVPQNETEGGASGEEAQSDETGGRLVTAAESEAAQQFLNFEGDFEGECKVEDAKWNLNYFYTLDPGMATAEGAANQYDSYRLLLTKFLTQERYKKLFDDNAEKAQEAVRNIADWVDKNNRMNELGGVEVGGEDSLYGGKGLDYYVKNGKFLSLDEVYLVAGVNDDWFTTLKDMFTIYGEGKINVCSASDDIIAALILRYSELNPNVPPIDQNNAKQMGNLVTAVRAGCQGVNPDVSMIAANLDAALGIGVAPAGITPPGTTTIPNTQTAMPQASSGSSIFASMISTQNRYYSLILKGLVGDTLVRISTVIDVEKDNPKEWKMLYWRMY